jgi:hypothetical protein
MRFMCHLRRGSCPSRALDKAAGVLQAFVESYDRRAQGDLMPLRQCRVVVLKSHLTRLPAAEVGRLEALGATVESRDITPVP